MKKYEEAESNLNKVEGEMREVEGELAFLKDKVSIVENKKNEYEFYAVEEKARRIKKKRELGNFIVGVEKRLEEVRKRHHEAVKEAEEARVKEKDLQWELE
jgi:chromosome segregation ATPase